MVYMKSQARRHDFAAGGTNTTTGVAQLLKTIQYWMMVPTSVAPGPELSFFTA